MTRYFRYVINNIEPIRVADDSSSQNRNTTTLKYIPGSTIRGMVINQFAKEENFDAIKTELFSTKIRYLNAYLYKKDKELLPSPKGFYEDKTISDQKEINNVVLDGTFTAGYKRASLGRYCYISEKENSDNNESCIYYYNVQTGSDLKININSNDEKKSLFRNEYILPGHSFVGYIAIEDESINENIKSGLEKIFSGDIKLGNARTAGLGKCTILESGYVEKRPYSEYMITGNKENECYMLLLSNMTMRNNIGELCGIDIKQLEKKMGVKDLKIKYCSTSTVNIKGYNRTWGGKVPSAMMYEQGSVFHLCYNGDFSEDNMIKICDEGLGIRTNEGFGRVLFIKNYELIKYKAAGKVDEIVNERSLNNNLINSEGEDEEVLTKIAKCYYKYQVEKGIEKYVVKKKNIGEKISKSQLGQILSLITEQIYSTGDSNPKNIEKYLGHAKDKEDNNKSHKARSNYDEINSLITEIFNEDIEGTLQITLKNNKIFGIDKDKFWSKNEDDKMKYKLISTMIKYENKEI